jgi:hypothetical protein
MKPEIINTSMEFVADFWSFAEEKQCEWNVTKEC